MKKYAPLVLSLLVLIFLCGSVASASGPLQVPVGTMTLEAPPGSVPEPTLSPVVFPHSLHFDYSCKDCHHEWDGEGPVQSCAASGCHENLWAAPPGTTPPGEKRVKSLSGAYHQSCRDCHRLEQKQQKAAGMRRIRTGPIACEGCHPEPHSEPVNTIEYLEIPVGELILSAPEGVTPRRGTVSFPHDLHFQYSCKDCHHEWDGESPVQGCATADCHDQVAPDESTRDIRSPENTLYYLAAYHNMCVTCHRDLNLERNALIRAGITSDEDLPVTGPVTCNGCHN